MNGYPPLSFYNDCIIQEFYPLFRGCGRAHCGIADSIGEANAVDDVRKTDGYHQQNYPAVYLVNVSSQWGLTELQKSTPMLPVVIVWMNARRYRQTGTGKGRYHAIKQRRGNTQDRRLRIALA
jgi:hypothetical protein